MGRLLLEKVGLEAKKVTDRKDYWAIEGWNRTLEGLESRNNTVVFFGNSITYYGQWEKAFRYLDVNVITMGYPGDDIVGMMLRIEPLGVIKPKKLFLMAGINGLKYISLDDFYSQYDKLVSLIIKDSPQTKVFLESILPVDKENMESPDKHADNAKIIKANKIIKIIAEKHNLQYIDVFHLFITNGVVNKNMFRDGIHPKKTAYYPWYNLLSPYIKK